MTPINFSDTYSAILFSEGMEDEPQPKPVVTPEPEGDVAIEIPALPASAAFHSAKDEVTASTFEYVPVEMPMSIDRLTGSVQFAGPTDRCFTFSVIGASYLGERFRSFKNSAYSDAFIGKEWELLEMMCNNDSEAQPTGKSRNLLLAIFNGEVVGVMKSYLPVYHSTLLEAIEKASLASYVSRWSLSQREMHLYIHAKLDSPDADAKSPLFRTYLAITNGHSGHTALSYYAAFVVGSYEFHASLGSRRSRHLGHVAELVDSLKESLDLVASINVEQRLAFLSCAEATQAIADTATDDGKAMAICAACAGSRDGLEVVERVAEYLTMKGYKSVAKVALNAVMRLALSK